MECIRGVLFTAILFCLTFVLDASTVCVICDSLTNDGCADPLQWNQYMRKYECPSGTCRRSTSVEKIAEKHLVIRTCNPSPESAGCEEKMEMTPYGRLTQRICWCNTDMCNSGNYYWMNSKAFSNCNFQNAIFTVVVAAITSVCNHYS